jgi:hypothetical protein
MLMVSMSVSVSVGANVDDGVGVGVINLCTRERGLVGYDIGVCLEVVWLWLPGVNRVGA